MKCAYCGKEAKATKEHIISSGVLDLFPECFLTMDEKRKVIHMFGNLKLRWRKSPMLLSNSIVKWFLQLLRLQYRAVSCTYQFQHCLKRLHSVFLVKILLPFPKRVIKL